MYRKRLSEPRKSMIAIKVTPAERQELKKLAAAAGLSVSAFLLGRVLGDNACSAALDALERDNKSIK